MKLSRSIFSAFFLGAVACAQAEASGRPNIIVILADDQGYADLGVQGVVKDVRTPHLDALAADGVRCTDAYVTAPQCSPSRAGLITGRYQQRFGFDTIPDCPLPLEETTLADRLHSAGYVCGMVGKWHLDPNPLSAKWIRANLPEMAGKSPKEIRIPESARLTYSPAARGFDEYFEGELERFWANYDLDGKSLKKSGEWLNLKGNYRIDVKTDAALAFIRRNKDKPFFLYLAQMAPHTPLDAPEKYLSRFPGPMPERRRYALAMISAIDDGVGRILSLLQEEGLADNTLIFFTSDNGAPLKITKEDTPPKTDPGGWDGSLNDPWVGEKGMLTDGGVRVPFLVSWKAALPEGKVFSKPVSTLDIAATAVAAAGLPQDEKLDGVNLIPFLTGKQEGEPHAALFWRFWNQAAIRSGHWKYLVLGKEKEFLFDLSNDVHETRNVLGENPEVAANLRAQLVGWTGQILPPGLPSAPPNNQEGPWYEHYLTSPTLPVTKKSEP